MFESFQNFTWSPVFGNLVFTPQNNTKLIFVFQMSITNGKSFLLVSNLPIPFFKRPWPPSFNQSCTIPLFTLMICYFFQVLMMNITSYSNNFSKSFKSMETWSLKQKARLRQPLLSFLAWKSKMAIISLDPTLHKSYSTFPKVTLQKSKSNNFLESSITSIFSCHMSITIHASCLPL